MSTMSSLSDESAWIFYIGIGVSMILGLGIGANNTANVCGVVYGTKSMSFRKINVVLFITRVIGTFVMST